MFKKLEMYEVPIYYCETNKFKTVSLSIKLKLPYRKEDSSKIAMLTQMMKMATNNLSSIQQFNQYLESLYGMKLSTSNSIQGKYHVIDVSSTIVNPKYIQTEFDLFNKQIHLLNEMIYQILNYNNQFDSYIFKEVQRQQIEHLTALSDDKQTYGFDQLIKHISDIGDIGYRSAGFIDEIKQETEVSLFEFYQKFLNEIEVSIYVVGQLQNHHFDLVSQLFNENKNTYVDSAISQFDTDKNLVYNEVKDMNQSHLYLAYKIDAHRNHDHHLLAVIFNEILGGGSESLLFKEVREKHSLCYSVYSMYDSFHGIVYIYAGIEASNKDQTLELINNQILNLSSVEVISSMIEDAKKQVISSIQKAKDQPFSLIGYEHVKQMTHSYSVDEAYIKAIERIKPSEITTLAKSMIKFMTYFLAGE